MVKYNKSLIVFIIPVAMLLFLAIAAPYIVPYDPYAQNLQEALFPPDTMHWLGTDRYGRDIFSRVLIGAQTTILSSLLLLSIISGFGSLIGIVCGYHGGQLDSVLMRISDIFLAFPGMVFAIAVAGVLGGGILNAVAALALIAWPKYARLARSLVLTIRHMPYMDAARMSGTATLAMIRHHVFPNIAGPILVTAALDIGTIIMELAGLSFLGLGAVPPTAEWGSMMSNGRSMLQTAPWVIISPGCAIFLTVAAFNLLGDKIRDMFDPKQQEG